MKKGNYVRLIKMSSSPDYVPGSADAELHPAVTPRPKAKENYWVEGFLAEDIALGGQIAFDTHLRNCYQVDAAFSTSPIVAIAGNEVMTEMSLFVVLRVPPFDPDKSLRAWL